MGRRINDMNRKTVIIIIALSCLSSLITYHLTKKSLTDKEQESQGICDEEQSVEAELPSIKYLHTDEHVFKNDSNPYCNEQYNSYFVTITLTNNTNQRISSFHLQGCIHLEFQGEKSVNVYYPNNSLSDISSLDEYTGFVDAIGTKKISLDKKWNPKEEKQFRFVIAECHNRFLDRDFGFSDKWFERTPIIAELIYKYKAIGIDGEFEDIIKIDILDDWKAYQTKLGLR